MSTVVEVYVLIFPYQTRAEWWENAHCAEASQ